MHDLQSVCCNRLHLKESRDLCNLDFSQDFVLVVGMWWREYQLSDAAPPSTVKEKPQDVDFSQEFFGEGERRCY